MLEEFESVLNRKDSFVPALSHQFFELIGLAFSHKSHFSLPKYGSGTEFARDSLDASRMRTFFSIYFEHFARENIGVAAKVAIARFESKRSPSEYRLPSALSHPSPRSVSS